MLLHEDGFVLKPAQAPPKVRTVQKTLYMYNRSTNSAAFCAKQRISFKPPFYANQMIYPFLNSRNTANHGKGWDFSQ